MNKDDLNIDRNLIVICESKDPTHFQMTSFTDEDGDRLYSKDESEEIGFLMEREGLIRIKDEFCAVEKKGFEAYNSGGWLKYLDNKEKENYELEINSKEKLELELEILKLQKEASEYQKSIREKEEKNRSLTTDNLRLNNWDIRFRWLIAIITLIAGYIVRYLSE